jgi:hypothetical protein
MTTKIDLSVHNGWGGIETVVEYIRREHLETRTGRYYEGDSVSAGDINACGCSNRRRVQTANSWQSLGTVM